MMEMVTGTVIPVAHASNTITMFIEVVVSLGFLPCSSLLCSCSLLLLVLLVLLVLLALLLLLPLLPGLARQTSCLK